MTVHHLDFETDFDGAADLFERALIGLMLKQ